MKNRRHNTIFVFNLAFDKQVEESKENATEALKLVPEIQKLIEEANDKTIGAQHALEGAESSAKNARDTVKQAQRIYDEQAAEVKCFKSIVLGIVGVVID